MFNLRNIFKKHKIPKLSCRTNEPINKEPINEEWIINGVDFAGRAIRMYVVAENEASACFFAMSSKKVRGIDACYVLKNRSEYYD